VGWFINHYPFRVWPGGRDDAGLIEHVGTELGQVPHDGLGHGLLTWCCRDEAARTAVRALQRPPVGMMYYGGLHDAYRDHGAFRVLHEYSYDRSRPHDDEGPGLALRAGQDRGVTWWHVLADPARYGPAMVAALSREVSLFLRRVCAP
jgi:hypothetical protein